MDPQRELKSSCISTMSTREEQNLKWSSIIDLEKDLGRQLKELVSNKEMSVTLSLLEQMLMEIRATKSLCQSGVARLGHKFGEILEQQRSMTEKLSTINASLMSDSENSKASSSSAPLEAIVDDTVVGAIRKSNRLLADLLVQGVLKEAESDTRGSSEARDMVVEELRSITALRELVLSSI